jgi:acyl-CoA synthetase (NDP forming)
MKENVKNPKAANLQRVLKPTSIAIVGISEDERSLGGLVLANLERLGYQGQIHLVSRNASSVRGHRCVADVKDLPLGVDVAVLALPESALVPTVKALGQRGVGGAIVFAAGFSESGKEGVLKQMSLLDACEAAGICLVGPNCMGLTNFNIGAGMSFDTILPVAAGGRGVAIVAQSGAMANNLREAVSARGVPVTFAISTGNEAMVGTEDFLEACLYDERTSLVAVYAEQIRDGHRFVRLAVRARELGKPVVLFLIGKSLRAREAAQSHTGAMTGDYATAHAVLACEAVVIPATLDEMVDVIPLLLRNPRPSAGGVAFVTGSGATKNIALDIGDDLGLDFPPFSQRTVSRLRELLPSFAVCENPLDYTTVAIKDPSLMGEVIDTVSADENCACLVVAQVPGSAVNQADKSIHMVPAVLRSPRPSALVILGDGSSLEPALGSAMMAPGLASYRSLDRCMKALALYQSYAKALRLAGGRWTNEALPLGAPLVVQGATHCLTEHTSKKLLAARGVAVPLGGLCKTLADAFLTAANIGYPVAIKAQAALLPHKSDAGGVIVNIRNAAGLEQSWEELRDNIATHCAGVVLDGVLVERMAEPGIELVVGARRDPNWGVVTLFGLGGVWIEALKDVRLLPGGATESQIVDALRSLKARSVLDGIRGGLPVNLGAISAVVQGVADLMKEDDSIAEIDLNPLRAYSHGAVALDALIVRHSFGEILA